MKKPDDQNQIELSCKLPNRSIVVLIITALLFHMFSLVAHTRILGNTQSILGVVVGVSLFVPMIYYSFRFIFLDGICKKMIGFGVLIATILPQSLATLDDWYVLLHNVLYDPPITEGPLDSLITLLWR